MLLEQVFDGIARNLNKFETEFMKEMLKTVKRFTPVDTGRLRKGWHRHKNIIGNNVKYVKHVEYGTVNQSAAGMLRRATMEKQIIADKVSKKLKK